MINLTDSGNYVFDTFRLDATDKQGRQLAGSVRITHTVLVARADPHGDPGLV
jgi:hypothetical protein